MSTIGEAKIDICSIVNTEGPIKLTDLLAKLPPERTIFNIPSIVITLVKEGKFLSVEYILPATHSKVEAILFPLGTTIILGK